MPPEPSSLPKLASVKRNAVWKDETLITRGGPWISLSARYRSAAAVASES